MNVLVTDANLVVAFSKLLLYGFGSLFPIENVYSSYKVGKFHPSSFRSPPSIVLLVRFDRFSRNISHYRHLKAINCDRHFEFCASFDRIVWSKVVASVGCNVFSSFLISRSVQPTQCNHLLHTHTHTRFVTSGQFAFVVFFEFNWKKKTKNRLQDVLNAVENPRPDAPHAAQDRIVIRNPTLNLPKRTFYWNVSFLFNLSRAKFLIRKKVFLEIG